MTPDEAHAKLVTLYQDLGVPKSFPFVGNIWDRITASLIAAIQKQGEPALQQAMSDALAAGVVLAQSTPTPTSNSTATSVDTEE